MRSGTVLSDGKDSFKDNIFSAREWSAPTMVLAADIRDRINSFNLCGKKIRDLKFVGLDYSHTRDIIEDSAYAQLGELSDEERQLSSDYKSIDPKMKFPRCALIGDPFLIEFEDGDIFEIDTPQSPEYRMSMNCISWWIDSGANPPNSSASLLFDPCIGQAIVDVEANAFITDKDPMFYRELDEEPFEREIVSNIVLRLENGWGIRISPWLDHCRVECIDDQDRVTEMDFALLRDALFNYEDIRIDESCGFEARSSMIFFGEAGKSCVGRPSLPLSPPDSEDSVLYIHLSDFTALEWSITHITEHSFDEFKNYRFSYKEWFLVLEDALRLLSVKTFDELFDETIGWNIKTGDNNCMLYRLNTQGEKFWNKQDQYRILVEDVIEWSKTVLDENGTLEIWGI